MDPTLLDIVQAVKRHLADRGFPCPAPILPPTELERGSDHWVTVESWIADPGMRPFSGHGDLVASAATLADQVRLCRSTGIDVSGLNSQPLHQEAGSLYPEPHSPLFDFVATAEGAGWIDSMAQTARSIRDADSTTEVVAHTDWSTRNVRSRIDG